MLESYQQLLDELELARSVLAINQSQKEFAEGKDRDAREALEELRAKYDIPMLRQQELEAAYRAASTEVDHDWDVTITDRLCR